MKVGIIGVGMVGGTLRDWFLANTTHELAFRDPQKGLDDNLYECDAIFICIPIAADVGGQDTRELQKIVKELKASSKARIFIKSTVLPGTCDALGIYACPEFLTERTAHEDMDKYPVVIGALEYPNTIAMNITTSIFKLLFPFKQIIIVSNFEAEAGKFMHNCFGALKVTYANIFSRLAGVNCADFDNIKRVAGLTGFLGETHLQVPGPDGKYGYGGKCFPDNIEAMCMFLAQFREANLFLAIRELNEIYRKENSASEVSDYGPKVTLFSERSL